MRGPPGTGSGSFSRECYILMPPTWRSVGIEEPRPSAWGGARPALVVKTTTSSPPERTCSMDGRTVLHGAERAWAAWHGVLKLRSYCFKPNAANLARCRCGIASANGEGRSAARVCRENNHAKSASARVIRGQSAGFPRGAARAGRAARDSNAAIRRYWSRCCRPGGVSVQKSHGQRRRLERVVHLPRRQPWQVRQRARAPWAVERFSAGRSARGPRGTGFKFCG